jgi:hypothetical protein
MRTASDFRDIVATYMGHIQLMYRRFADKKPVMELSLPSRKIYAYPYSEYLKTLSKRSQEFLKKEYRAAIAENRMIVFVRDNEARTLKSASYPIERIAYVENDINQFSEGDT